MLGVVVGTVGLRVAETVRVAVALRVSVTVGEGGNGVNVGCGVRVGVTSVRVAVGGAVCVAVTAAATCVGLVGIAVGFVVCPPDDRITTSRPITATSTIAPTTSSPDRLPRRVGAAA